MTQPVANRRRAAKPGAKSEATAAAKLSTPGLTLAWQSQGELPALGPKAEPHLVMARRGRMRFKARQYDAAAAAFRKAVENQPDYAPAHMFLGASLYESGHPREAVHPLREAVKFASPEHYVNFCCTLAMVLYELEKFSDAEAVYRRALDVATEEMRDKLIYVIAICQVEQEQASRKPSEQRQNSDLVSSETLYTSESPSPGDAEQPQLPMADIIDAIDRLAAFVPDGAGRETYKAKLIADFEDATGITVRRKDEARLKWEQDALPGENPAAFAWRAYQAEAEAGTLHRGLIAQEDKPLSIKLANWLRTHNMPKGIDIPTKPEWTSRRLAEFGGSPRPTRIWTEEGRLSQAARYRTTKAALAKS